MSEPRASETRGEAASLQCDLLVVGSERQAWRQP